MSRTSIVLVATEDAPSGAAIFDLGRRVQTGIVRPFWFVDAKLRRSRPWPGSFFDLDGKSDVALFTSLGNRTADEIRVVTVSSAGDDAEAAKTAQVADAIVDQLMSLAPSGADVRAVRIWFPDWQSVNSPGPGFFSPSAHANLVVVPEDRRSGRFVAAPVGPQAAEQFVGHIAAEVAVLAGLLTGMEHSPTDSMQPGVFFGTNPKVRLARSFLRIGKGPKLPLQDVVRHEGRLPIPPGTVEAPSPLAAVADLVDRADSILAPLAFAFREPDPPERHRMRPGQTLALIVKEMGSFIASLPRRAAEGVLEDLGELAGRTMQDLVGHSSVVEVVWRGKYEFEAETPDDVESLVDDLKEKAIRRLDLQGGPSIDQTVWRDIGALVLSAADGGQPPPGIKPTEVHGRRAVINDAAALAPPPGSNLVETAAWILDEPDSEENTSMLGRLGARVNATAESNKSAVSRLLGALDERVALLASYRPPSLGFWHIAGGVLLAVFAVSTLLFSGAVRGMGITNMPEMPRVIIYAGLSLAVAGLLYLFRSYAQEAVAEAAAHQAAEGNPPAKLDWTATGVGALAGSALSGAFIGLGAALFGYPATEPATYAALLTGLLTGAGLGLAYTLTSHPLELPPLGRMARLSIITVLSYGAILLTGAIAQPVGWYAAAEGNELRSLILPSSGSLALLLIVVLAYVSWRRVQEKLRLNAFGSSIKQLAEQVSDALTGDRIAEAAREQFLGLSAVLSRLIWYPYGRRELTDDETPVVESFGVNKATACEFNLSNRGRQILEARTKALASERGWLAAQYETSILQFRQDLADLLGAGDIDSVGRPDEDPNTVSQWDLEERSDKGDRWRWAELLFEGAYDVNFLAQLEEHAEEEVFEPILASSGNFDVAGECSADVGSLVEYIFDIQPGEDGQVAVRYFDATHLASNAFARAWHSQLWWPAEPMFDRTGSQPTGFIRPIGSLARGTLWIAARADMTEDLEPAAIFGTEADLEVQPSAPGFDY